MGPGREAAQRDDRQPFPRLNKGKRRRVGRPNPVLTLGTAGSAVNAAVEASARGRGSLLDLGRAASRRMAEGSFWHKLDPLLSGTFRGRQPRQFGTFLTQSGHPAGNVTLVVVKLSDAVPPRPNAKLSVSNYVPKPSTNEGHHVSSSSKALACFKSTLSKPSVNQP